MKKNLKKLMYEQNKSVEFSEMSRKSRFFTAPECRHVTLSDWLSYPFLVEAVFNKHTAKNGRCPSPKQLLTVAAAQLSS